MEKKAKKVIIIPLIFIAMIIIAGKLFQKHIDQRAENLMEENIRAIQDEYTFEDLFDKDGYIKNEGIISPDEGYVDIDMVRSSQPPYGNEIEVEVHYKSEDMDEGNGTVYMFEKPDESMKTTLKISLDCYFKRFPFIRGHAEDKKEIFIYVDNGKEKITPVLPDEIKKGSYEKKMTLQESKNGNIKMKGDFGENYIYGMKDAATASKAYSEILGVPGYVDVRTEDARSCKINGKYERQYDVFFYCSGFKLDGYGINVFVDENFKMSGISVNMPEKFPVIDVEKQQIGMKECIKDFCKENKIAEYEVITGGIGADWEEIYGRYVRQEDDRETFLTRIVKDKDIFVPLEAICDENGTPYQRIMHLDGKGTDEYIDFNLYTGEAIRLDARCMSAESEYEYFKNTTHSGTTERGETLSFESSDGDILRDECYDIWVREIKDGFKEFEEQKNIEDDGEPIIYRLKCLVKENLYADENNEFHCPEGVETYKYLQDAYSWFDEQFDFESYDGKGSRVYAYVNYKEDPADNSANNAYWSNTRKQIQVCPKAEPENYTYAVWPETMPHEYTHGIHSCFKHGYTENLKAIDEAYADIFACLIVKDNDWYMFKRNWITDSERTGRDLKNFVAYDEDNLSGDPHKNGLILGNIAYEMWKSGLYTDKEMADIWFSAMRYGIWKGDGYENVRGNVEIAMEDENYLEEQRNFVIELFEKRNIGSNAELYKVGGNEEQQEKEKTVLYMMPTGYNDKVLKTVVLTDRDFSPTEKQKNSKLH